MTLALATLPSGRKTRLAGPAPFACDALRPLVGVPFDLPCDDPWILDDASAGHTYVEAAAAAWAENPDWMDYLDLDSPAWGLKVAARDLYLHAWADHVRAGRVLDVGCGIGRMTHRFLDVGATVVGVDPDLHALRRCAWRAVGRPGRLDLRWSTAHRLPDWGDVDVAIATEVLCYVPDAAGALRGIVDRLKPGGVLLVSVEAPYGWAASPDAPEGALQAALDGVRELHVPDDRWVRLYDDAELRTLLEGAGLAVTSMLPMLYVPEGPLERLVADGVSLETLVAAEARCRTHPVWAPLNRVWAAAARKPAREN